MGYLPSGSICFLSLGWSNHLQQWLLLATLEHSGLFLQRIALSQWELPLQRSEYFLPWPSHLCSTPIAYRPQLPNSHRWFFFPPGPTWQALSLVLWEVFSVFFWNLDSSCFLVAQFQFLAKFWPSESILSCGSVKTQFATVETCILAWFPTNLASCKSGTFIWWQDSSSSNTWKFFLSLSKFKNDFVYWRVLFSCCFMFYLTLHIM